METEKLVELLESNRVYAQSTYYVDKLENYTHQADTLTKEYLLDLSKQNPENIIGEVFYEPPYCGLFVVKDGSILYDRGYYYDGPNREPVKVQNLRMAKFMSFFKPMETI
jgi:hypothetical protein